MLKRTIWLWVGTRLRLWEAIDMRSRHKELASQYAFDREIKNYNKKTTCKLNAPGVSLGEEAM